MTTTGELRAIIEELELVDIGEAASYLGEEATVAEELPVSEQKASSCADDTSSSATDNEASC